MSFPWWESTIPAEYRATFPRKLESMLVQDAQRRAEILYSLGFDLATAQQRLRAYLAWDYEVKGLPAAAAQLEEVVRAVYARRSGGKAVPAAAPAKAVESAKSPAAPKDAKATKSAKSAKSTAKR